RRDSAGFLVDVVLQRRLGEITGRDAEEVLAEACWDDDRRIRVAALDCLEGFLVGHEVPAEIVVPPELLLDLIPDIDSTCQIGRRALIEVRHGDADVLRVRIRVPEGADVEPRVQRRGDENPDHDDPRLAYAGESADVAREHLPTSLHSNIVHATCTSLCTMRAAASPADLRKAPRTCLHAVALSGGRRPHTQPHRSLTRWRGTGAAGAQL